MLLGQRGDHEESEECFREALRIPRETLGEDHPDVVLNLNNLGSLLSERGERVPAEGLLLAAHDVLQEGRGEDDPETRRARRELEELYPRWGRSDEASKYAEPSEERR